jgi:hypothetical protein
MAATHTLANLTAATTTAGTNSTAAVIGGYWRRAIIVLDHTASGVDAADTLDVYVDVSIDGSKWVNAVHFAQKAGNAAASTEFAILDPSNPGTATVVATSDNAVSTVRPSAFGMQMRERHVIVNGAGGNAPSHTYSVKAFVQ